MSRRTRWLPAVVAPLVVAAAVAVPVSLANAAPHLPQHSAAQILASVQKASQLQGYSATVQQVSNLGLPQLPAIASGARASSSSQPSTTDLLTMLTSNQTARVSVSRGVGARVQLLEGTGERDVVTNRHNVWLWDASSQSATHVVLPTLTSAQRAQLVRTEPTMPSEASYSPLKASQALIKGLDSHTRVTVGSSRYVAGKAAYTLVFTPKERGTLVGSVQVQVDAKTGLPLRFAVYAHGDSSPAYQLGYTKLSYGAPAASTFTFKPAPGVKVKTIRGTAPQLQKQLQANAHRVPGSAPKVLPKSALPASPFGKAQTVGTGWASIVTVPASASTKQLLGNKNLTSLTTKLGNGDQAIETKLMNVVFHADGSVSFGSVPVSALTSR